VPPPRTAAPSLLAVFAHPDDESIACGGLLARCAAEGVRASLLCLTRGGLGELDDPARAQMGETRRRELDDAAAVLGLEDVTLLDYRNGFLPWADRAALESDIRAAIDRAGATVVVTFDDDGLYWHPDHIVVHERTTAVVAGMGRNAPALFYVSIPKGAMRAAWQTASAAAESAVPVPPVVLGVEVDAYGLFASPPTLILDVGSFARTKLRAVRCHRSQVAGDALDRLPDGSADPIGLEQYRRAPSGAQGPTFLDGWSRPA
jgi:LmbE family N-acetylglucosaminyl deacetylase